MHLQYCIRRLRPQGGCQRPSGRGMMKIAQVRQIYSLEVPNLEAYIPEVPEIFYVPLRLIVGPRGEEGEESFDVGVCSPGWLSRVCEKDGFAVGRHFLIVNSFDWPLIKSVLTKLIERCHGNSWTEIAEKVGRIGYWEMEDYRAEAHSP
jgi:hypothetical protein